MIAFFKVDFTYIKLALRQTSLSQQNRIPMPLFQNAAFHISAHHLRDLPLASGIEVAFAGRSNAGKSSALIHSASAHAWLQVPWRSRNLANRLDAYHCLT